MIDFGQLSKEFYAEIERLRDALETGQITKKFFKKASKNICKQYLVEQKKALTLSNVDISTSFFNTRKRLKKERGKNSSFFERIGVISRQAASATPAPSAEPSKSGGETAPETTVQEAAQPQGSADAATAPETSSPVEAAGAAPEPAQLATEKAVSDTPKPAEAANDAESDKFAKAKKWFYAMPEKEREVFLSALFPEIFDIPGAAEILSSPQKFMDTIAHASVHEIRAATAELDDPELYRGTGFPYLSSFSDPVPPAADKPASAGKSKCTRLPNKLAKQEEAKRKNGGENP